MGDNRYRLSQDECEHEGRRDESCDVCGWEDPAMKNAGPSGGGITTGEAIAVTRPWTIQPIVDALEDMFAMIDEGLLVRDISKDRENDFTMNMLGLIKRLKKNQEALLKAKGEVI